MNYLVGAIIFLFVLFLAAKGRLGLYASMLLYTAPAPADSGTQPSAPGPTAIENPATNAAVLHNQISPFNALPQIGDFFKNGWNWLTSPPTGTQK